MKVTMKLKFWNQSWTTTITKHAISRPIKLWPTVTKCLPWPRLPPSNLAIARVDIVFTIYMHDLSECKLILPHFWLDYTSPRVLYTQKYDNQCLNLISCVTWGSAHLSYTLISPVTIINMMTGKNIHSALILRGIQNKPCTCPIPALVLPNTNTYAMEYVMYNAHNHMVT